MDFPPLLARMRQFAPLTLILVSAAAAVAAYLQALNYSFVSDDNLYITNNARLAGLHLTELWLLFVEPYNEFSEFLPLRELSYWLDIKMFGLNPSAFRVHNILLYLLCLPLVYSTTLCLWRYFRPADASAPWAAAASTALFAVHPSHAEAVVWIAGRKDVLSAMFSLFALWLAVRAKREHGLSVPHAVAALVALLAAMLSKASAFGVAPLIATLWVLFWLDIPVSGKHRSPLLWPLASLLLTACVALIFAATIKSRIPIYFGVETVTRTLAILGWLARLALSPESRHYYYPVFEDPYLPAMVTLGVVVLATAAISIVIILRRRSLEGFALAAFLLLCIPSMQMIPYAPPSLVSDRFVFLAVWPVILLLVALSWRLKPAPRTILLLAIALPWGFQNAKRPHDWISFEVMVDTDLRAYPGYYMPAFQKIIGIQLPQGLNRDAGETANGITDPEIRNIAIKLIRADYAVRANAVDTGDPHNAMTLLLELGFDLKQWPVRSQWNAPLRHVWKYCRIALAYQWNYLTEHFPDDAPVRYNAGLWMLNIQKYEYAATHLRAATESQRLPESVRGAAFKSLGLALLRSGQIVEAEAPLRTALEQSPPDLRAHCLLLEVYQQARRFEEAARAEADCLGSATDKETAQ